jgi:SAM-dependent methyltransferase
MFIQRPASDAGDRDRHLRLLPYEPHGTRFTASATLPELGTVARVRVRVLLTSRERFVAIEPVLAELDEARRSLEPGDIDLEIELLPAAPDGARDRAERLGTRLVEHPPSSPGAGLRGESPSPITDLVRAWHDALDDGVDAIVTLDADGQHDARQIPDLVRCHLARGSGLTIGSRWARGGSAPGSGLTRGALSRAGNRITTLVTGARGVSDSTTSFRVYSPDLVRVLVDEPLPDAPHGAFSAIAAFAQAHGFTVDEVPITFRPRYVRGGDVDRDDLTEFASSLLPVRRRVRAIRRAMRHDQSVWAQRNPKLRAQHADAASEFGATEELFQLADAHHFMDWIVAEIEPHLGHRVVEVGAGVGAIATRLAELGHEVTALEPAPNVFPELRRRSAGVERLEVRSIPSHDHLAIAGPGSADSVVYVSVLEHVLDDVAELRTAFELVRPGGTVVAFVPAMPSLYGSLDFKSGHYRRYDRPMITDAIHAAGFDVVDVHHLDILGVVPYAVMYRMLGVSSLGSGSSATYDRVIVPASRIIQPVAARAALGKNLLAAGRRPPATSRSV